MSLVDMQGQVALVSGGARGIGRGIVTALAGAGARVAIADLRADLAESKQRLRSPGGLGRR
jgi:NAD(P)-dependent dehydrogenase (short-subunit alcohol dehydrogenase family)